MENSSDNANLYDPSTLKCRIGVKNFPPNNNQQELKNAITSHFEKYGKIVSVTLHPVTKFIQFENEEAASCAIQMEHNTSLEGCILKVFQPRPPTSDRGDFNNKRDQSPVRGRSPQGPMRGRSPVRGRSPMRGRSPPRDDWRPRFNDDYGDSYNKNPYYPQPSRYPPMERMEPMEPAAPPPVKAVNPAERTNDCEILIFDRENTNYGESLERRLKNLGLSADILFPNTMIPLGKLLGNISKRGTLYAISVYPVNQAKESFTVNILQGDSEEHRNIPFEQGINLITINFDKYIQNGGQRTAPAVVPNGGNLGPSMHPEAIQTMINLLLQKRPLTVVQYDALSNYLEQLKAKQAKLELGDALPVTLESGGTDDLLKNRIMSIMDQTLNKGSQPMFNPLPQTTIPQPAIPAAKPHMLQDPNIQQALNNLLSGGNFNFFK